MNLYPRCVTFLLLIIGAHSFGYNDWDFLIFAQTWTPSVCQVADEETPGSCKIPSDVNSWTVHGLWPSMLHGSHEPAFCSHQHFNITSIESLVPQLKIRWPNVIPTASISSLWKHEWEKHGTCASVLPSLATEFDYFNQGLKLRQFFDLEKYLSAAGIQPSKTSRYSTSDIAAALNKNFKGGYSLHCVKDKDDPTSYLSEIRLCLTKQFELMDCPANDLWFSQIPPAEFCPEQGELAYPIFPSTLQHRNDYSLSNFMYKLYQILLHLYLP